MKLEIIPCLDSEELAAARRNELDISREKAAELGRTVADFIERGFYIDEDGKRKDWGDAVSRAGKAKQSIPPDAELPDAAPARFDTTEVRVANETTLRVARGLVERGLRPLALNFANGINPGGGFLDGAKAQEEVLCRSSALYATLKGDPMYAAHRQRPRPDSTAWAILSPDVPVFRNDAGKALPAPWLLSFITCAAPCARVIGQPESGDLLAERIRRVLAIATAYGYEALVLGAWGCGAFRNDTERTARDFKLALEAEFSGCFSHVHFAVTDWSPERRFLGPFRDVFAQ